MSDSVKDELRELKDKFLKSISDYLDDCIVLEDVKRMRRFIASVSDYLREEASKPERKKRWRIILKDVKVTADFPSPVSLDKALEKIGIDPGRVEEAY